MDVLLIETFQGSSPIKLFEQSGDGRACLRNQQHSKRRFVINAAGTLGSLSIKVLLEIACVLAFACWYLSISARLTMAQLQIAYMLHIDGDSFCSTAFHLMAKNAMVHKRTILFEPTHVTMIVVPSWTCWSTSNPNNAGSM